MAVLQRLGEMSRERKQRRQAAAMDNFRISFVSRKPKLVVKACRLLPRAAAPKSNLRVINGRVLRPDLSATLST